MANIDPAEAATIAHGSWAEGQPLSPLNGFVIDSRVLERGETFVALKTARRDGHAFLRQARERGALAAMVSQPDHSIALPQLVVEDTYKSLRSLARVWRQRFTRPVVGITGSYGKTTVKEMLGTVMGSQWYRTRDNLNNTLGVPLSILDLDTRHDAGAILEAGINMPGEMDILADLIDPDLAIITAVGPAHLEALGDIEGVAREKSRLAHGLRPGGQLVIPAGLLEYDAFGALPDNIHIHAVSVNRAGPGNLSLRENVTIYNYTWTESAYSLKTGALEITEPYPKGSLAFQAGSPGMVSNLALVVHAALHFGVPLSTLEACLESWRPFRHRGETWCLGDCTYYVDCYNANPGSLLDSVRRFKNLFAGQPHLYVLGSMDELGTESARWHRETAAKLDLPSGAHVFLIGHGANDMRDGLEATGCGDGEIHTVTDLEPVRESIEYFSGAVYLKASRSYALETLLPEGAQRC
jgi:UDP-N-acetylmuramoyl-tripeptide--D-alanyl-D-alanine ligase